MPNDTVSLGDFLAEGGTPKVEGQGNDTVTLDSFMNGEASTIEPSESIKTIPEEHKQGFLSGFGNLLLEGIGKGAASFNDLLFTVTDIARYSNPVGFMPGYKEARDKLKNEFVDEPTRATKRFEEKRKTENPAMQFVNDLTVDFANLGVTLPMDIMSGGATKAGLTKMALPEIEAIIKRIPNFALGSGWRGLMEGMKAENPMEAPIKGISGAVENMAINTIYSKAGIGIKGISAMTALGAANSAYEAAKEGRPPTQEELIKGSANGAAYGIIFTLFPFITKATKTAQEKYLASNYEKDVNAKIKSGDLDGAKKVINDMLGDTRLFSQGIYQKVFNRFQSIEDTVEKAKALGFEVKPGEDAGLSATRYLSIVNQAQNTLEQGTFKVSPEGKVEVTGEGLKPILLDYEKASTEKDIKVRDQDLKDYLIAKRTVEDLQRPKGEGQENIATAEQVTKAQSDLQRLNEKYGIVEAPTGEQPRAGGMIQEAPKYVKDKLEQGVTITNINVASFRITKATTVKDIHNNKIELPVGHEFTEVQLSNGKIWLHDGKNLVVDKSTLQNLPKNSYIQLGEKIKYSSEIKEAIDNTVGAKLTGEGLEVDLSRYQKPEQSGEESIRTGVFYLPELKSPYGKYYSTGKFGYGGGEKIVGRTLLKLPVMVNAGTGGKGVEKAYDQIEGKGSYQAMRSDVLNNSWTKAYDRNPSEDSIKKLLEKYGGNPDLASEIIRNSKTGNTLPYAIQEHIAAHVIRKAGYDSVVSYSKSAGKLRLSEVYDVRALEYPTKDTAHNYPEFYNSPQAKNMLKVEQPMAGGMVYGKEEKPETIKTSPFESTAKRLYDYQARVLHLLVDSGNMTEEQYKNIVSKNPNYIPFDRIMPEEKAEGILSSKNRFGAKSPIKKIKGSEKEIHDPIESMIKNTYKIMDRAARNKVFQDIYKLKEIEALGIKDVSPDFEPIKVNAKETGGEETTIFRPSKFKPKGNVIEGYIDGKRKYIETSENLYQAMTGMDEVSVSLITRILSKPAQMLRTGATLTPEFMLRNPIRDQWTALIQTNLGFKPFVDAGGAIADVLGKTEIYNDWIRSGGSYSGFVELSRPKLAKMVNELKGNRSLASKLNIIINLQDLSQLFEQATRIGVFKAGLRKGMSAVESAKASRESTIDFSRRGSATKDFNAAIAFFNAGLQGIDKTIRTAAKDPVGTTVKAVATITIPSLALYLLNRNDPEYKEIPRWQKDLFWVFKVNGQWMRIPKPFSYGQIFGSLPERFFEYLDTKDTKAFDKLAESLYDSLSPVAGDPMSGLLPTALKPLLENVTNWSFFKGRPIVPESKSRLIPSEQYGRYDSATAKMLGKVLNVSPSKIENFVQGYLGGSGKYLLQGTDKAMEIVSGESKESRPIEASDIPLVKGFTVSNPMSGQAESVQKFYNNKKSLEQSYNTYRKMLREGRREEAMRLRKNNPNLFKAKIFTNYSGSMSEIDKQIDRVVSSKIDESAKREKIKKLEAQKVTIARRANAVIE